MKKFISKIQNLSQRAAELQAAMQNVPPTFAELRETVSMTAGQLKQMRTEVEQGIADLKTDGEDRLIDSLREINASVQVFQQAGYDLAGVDLELSPIQQLIVHLNRVQDVSTATLRHLRTANENRKVTSALLQSLIQAETMADQIDLSNLVYYKLLLRVGPIPSVQLCWRTENVALLAESPATESPGVPDHPPARHAVLDYGQDSFFGRRDSGSTIGSAAAQSQPTPSAAAGSTAGSSGPAPSAPAASSGAPKAERGAKRDWGRASLERFKKMPSVSKYRR